MQQTQDGRQPSRPTWTYRSQRCVATPAVALCSDDDWVSKCPSGCRLQGLISQMESEVERKLQKVCKTRKMHEDAADVSMMATTQIYTSLSKNSRQASNLKFVENVGGLARSLTSLRRRSSCLSQKLKELRSNVERQIEDLYRTEVDVDMKLRACRGSCRSAPPFSVNHPSYQTLRTDLDQMDKSGNQRSKGTAPQRGIPHVKLRTVDVGPAPSAEYRTMPTVRGELLTQFILEELLEEPADVEVCST
uniref:Fibrinogen alpha/beta/gamma chain coiled coil domain-containing protein n=1 Tax=Mastacembelus armatus TaxID=205130 RepID=A0A7N8Y3D3_9TELE